MFSCQDKQLNNIVSTTIKIQHEEKIDNKKEMESEALMKIKKLIAIDNAYLTVQSECYYE